MPAWNWHLIRRFHAEGGQLATVARDSRFSRDVVSAVCAGVPAHVRYLACRHCSATNRYRDRKCRHCGEPMNTKNPGLAEIALILRGRIEEVSAKEFIRISRHRAGEVCIPKGAKLSQIRIYSGPIGASHWEAFAELYTSTGQPVLIDVAGGVNFELPPNCFSCHQIALVADAPTAATVRLRG